MGLGRCLLSVRAGESFWSAQREPGQGLGLCFALQHGGQAFCQAAWVRGVVFLISLGQSLPYFLKILSVSSPCPTLWNHGLYVCECV